MSTKNIKNLGIYFDNISKKIPNRIALRFNKKEKISFKDLNDLSNQFFLYFKNINLKSNDQIAIESKKNIYSFAIIIASLKLGIAYSFVNFSESEKRAKLILERLKAKKVFLFENKKGFSKSIYLSDSLVKEIKKINTKGKLNFINESSIAYVMFTSGSTGEPKGVKITHFNLIFFINWVKKTFKINQTSIMTNLNPLHFDNSVFDIYGSIFNKATLVPIEKSEILNCRKLFSKLKETKCNLWFSVPSLLNLILKIEKPKIFKSCSIKKIIFGGEKFPIESMRNIYKYLKNSLIFNVSGPTECTCMCSAHLVNKKELFQKNNISVGKINNYFNYKIAKSDIKKNSLKRGELYLEGPAVSLGYINDRKRTLEKFYKAGKYYGYKTGDIVIEGKNKNLNIIGREDNQIKFLGHRIEIEEIENNINNIFKLKECLVIFTKKTTFPYEKLILLTDKKSINSEYILKKLSNHLPKYMIPEDIRYVNSFKLNQNGKVDRKYYSKIFRI